MRRAVLVGSAVAFVVLVVAASVLANGDWRLDQDAGHVVVVRNEAAVPALVQLSDANVTLLYEIEPGSEAPLTASSTVRTIREVALLDAACAESDVLRFGGGIEHRSDLAALVVQRNSSLGFLLPEDLASWDRPPLPSADAHEAPGCVAS